MNRNKDLGVIGNFFLLLAEKTDGKKTLSSFVLIIGGLATLFLTPEHDEAGVSLLSIGITGLFVGLTHKAVKTVNSDSFE